MNGFVMVMQQVEGFVPLRLFGTRKEAEELTARLENACVLEFRGGKPVYPPPGAEDSDLRLDLFFGDESDN
jgi:hypothetical protein